MVPKLRKVHLERLALKQSQTKMVGKLEWTKSGT